MLDENGLAKHVMPCNVLTRWNSTYDMLNFALNYRVALDLITANHDMKLVGKTRKPLQCVTMCVNIGEALDKNSNL